MPHDAKIRIRHWRRKGHVAHWIDRNIQTGFDVTLILSESESRQFARRFTNVSGDGVRCVGGACFFCLVAVCCCVA